MKEIKWNIKAREFVKSLELETRKEIGALLLLIQKGVQLNEPQSKPFRSIHKNAFELRIKDSNGTYRIIYILKIDNLILIPHAFTKKSQKTPKKEIRTSIRRLKELINEIK